MVFLPLLLLSSLALAPAAAAQTPSSTVWIGRSTGTEYVYDTPVPADLAAMLTCDATKYGGYQDGFCTKSTRQVDGQTVELVSTPIGWDQNAIGSGRLAYARGGSVGKASWWQHLDGSTPAWKTAADEIDEQAISTGGAWKRADLSIYVSPTAGGTPLRVPIPELTQLKTRMATLGKDTGPGLYGFANVSVPTDLAGYRDAMLAYGNVGRRDPEFRTTFKSTTARNLSGSQTDTRAGLQDVLKDNQTPPYFTDHRPVDALQKAAQFQAEYLASTDRLSHDGPSTGRNPETGQSGPAATAQQRSALFGGPANVTEAAAAGGLADAPHGWMVGETHFRPWFNVHRASPEIGYGAARAKSGTWYFVAVPTENPKAGASDTLGTLSLPATGTIGTAPAPGAATVSVNAATPPPTAQADGPTQTSAQTDAPAAGSGAADPTPGPATPAPASPAASEPVPADMFDKACDGFVAHLRQEVASREVSRAGDAYYCRARTVDIENAWMSVDRVTDKPDSAVQCADITQARGADPQSEWMRTLQSRATDDTLRPVTSSGPPGQAFPFIYIVEQRPGSPAVSVSAVGCDGTYLYNVHMERAEGINPLLAVNAAAEGIRRAAA